MTKRKNNKTAIKKQPPRPSATARQPVPQPESQTITSLNQLDSVWRMDRSVSWLVPDLLAEGSVNLLSADSGIGKTWLAYFLAGSVAHGATVFDKPVPRRKVLYIDGENPLFLVKQRLWDLGIAETPNLKIWGGWHADPPPGPNHPLIQQFAGERPLLIWDSLVHFHTGDEQSSTGTRRFMTEFRWLANRGATVVLLHHTGKSEGAQDYRGSSDIKAAVDMAFKLKSVGERNETLDQLQLEPFKCRLTPLPTRLLRFIQGHGFEQSAIVTTVRSTKPDPAEVVKEAVAAEPGLNQSAIVERASQRGIAKHKVEEALKRADIFMSKRGKGNQYRYFLTEDASPIVRGPTEAEAEPA